MNFYVVYVETNSLFISTQHEKKIYSILPSTQHLKTLETAFFCYLNLFSQLKVQDDKCETFRMQACL